LSGGVHAERAFDERNPSLFGAKVGSHNGPFGIITAEWTRDVLNRL
jgi:hypothetical protein